MSFGNIGMKTLTSHLVHTQQVEIIEFGLSSIAGNHC